MRLPSRLSVVLMAVLAVLLAPLAVHAGGVTTEDLIPIANEFGMVCIPNADAQECQTEVTDPNRWTATLRPASGLVTGTVASVAQYFPGITEAGQLMMVELTSPACGDRGAVADFVRRTSALADNTRLGPDRVGTCTLTGSQSAVPRLEEWYYAVEAAVDAPPTPSPRPTRRPTPAPTPVPTQRPALVPTAVPTPSPSPTASPRPTSTPPASASPTPTLEQQALPGNPTPAPSVTSAAATSLSAEHHRSAGALAASVAAPWQVSLEPAAIAGSAVLALLLLLFMGFASELFNSTVESNYDEIAGWLRLRRTGRSTGRLWTTPLGVGLFLAIGALVYLLIDPGIALDLETVAVYLGMLTGLGVVMLAFEVPPLLLYRRRTGESAGVRALPWTLPAAAVCVLVSRIAGLEPGYLYGLLLGLVFQQELTPGQEGRQTASGALWTLAVALAAWIGLGALRSGGVTADAFGGLLLETALAVVVVGGLEAVAFGLLPMRFLAGAAVYGWSRIAWALLFGIGAFAFIHLLVGPHTGYLAELSPGALVAAFGAFAAFGAVSILFWGYFRFRPTRA
jgi:hypothetical protein